MELVDNLKHFSSLVKRSKTFPGISVSNCFLLPASIQQYSQQKKLFWDEVKSGIYFFHDEGNYYRLYFYVTDHTEIQLGQQKKPVVIDLVYRDLHQTDILKEIENKWIEIHFSSYKSYKRMTLEANLNKRILDQSSTIYNPLYSVAYAYPEQCNELTALWKNTLDTYSNALPSPEDMTDAVNQQQILCVKDHNAHLAAAMQFIQQNKICLIQHVAVDENHRRKGLAKLLLQFCFSECKSVNRYVLWVEANNTPAIQLYQNIGFQFDGIVSNQLFRNQ